MSIIKNIFCNMSRSRGRSVSVARHAYISIVTVVAACVAESCANDGYDTGDGKYSYLSAELALVHTNSSTAAVSATLDDDTDLQFSSPVKIGGALKGDTIYRALLYYDKMEDISLPVKPRGITIVPVASVVRQADVKEMLTDPLGLESIWESKNGSYVNVSLLLKSGTTVADSKQSVGFVEEKSVVEADGTRRAVLRVYHDQSDVPQYYTVQQYVSIDTRKLDADIVELHANTYDGEVVKCVDMRTLQ